MQWQYHTPYVQPALNQSGNRVVGGIYWLGCLYCRESCSCSLIARWNSISTNTDSLKISVDKNPKLRLLARLTASGSVHMHSKTIPTDIDCNIKQQQKITCVCICPQRYKLPLRALSWGGHNALVAQKIFIFWDDGRMGCMCFIPTFTNFKNHCITRCINERQ